MNERDIIGMTIMISPVLWNSDHVGEIGQISDAEFRNNLISVKFPDKQIGSFSPKTVFMLRPAAELIELAENKQGYLWPPLPEQLEMLAAFEAAGSAKQLTAALKLVQNDPELHRLATIRLNEVIDLGPRRKTGR